MTIATNTAFEIPFFEMPPTLCKVYSDGEHYVAMPYEPTNKAPAPKQPTTYEREVFESLDTSRRRYAPPRQAHAL